MATDDLNFLPGPEDQSWTPPPSPMKRNLSFIAAGLGVVLVLSGLIAQAEFWLLWLTGSRATATIVRLEKLDVGHFPGMKGTRAGQLVEWRYHYTFTGADGVSHPGVFWMAAESQEWQVNRTIPIMYSASRPANNMPSEFGFHLRHDTPWVLGLTAIGIGLPAALLGIVGLMRWRRAKR